MIGVWDVVGDRQDPPAVIRTDKLKTVDAKLWFPLGSRNRRVARFLAWFDINWIDNVNVQVSKLTANVGRGLANVQNGQTQTYAAIMAIGFVVVLFALLVWGN